MKVLVLTFYFKPDLCAGSFRATAFVEAISSLLKGGDDVEVITTLPNRYHSFNSEADLTEKFDYVKVNRVPLPVHKSGMLDQSKAFVYFARQVLSLTRNKKYDLVFATSSRLFTAALGSVVAKRTNAQLYLDIRDIFTDTLKDVLNKKVSVFLLPILKHIEKNTIKAASKVNLVSEGFSGYFNQIYSGQNYSFFTNGIDDDFLEIDFAKREQTSKEIVLYAGNIGEGQGLEHIVPKAARKLSDKHEFWIIGDGGRKRELQVALEKEQVTNVKLIEPMDRKNLLKYYGLSDYLFLHLNSYDAFKKVLPSKIFEYAATGKPIIAGVDGYSKEFLLKYVPNSAVFKPCEADDFVEKIGSLSKKLDKRTDFIQTFKRQNIMYKMAKDVLGIVVS